MKYHDETSQLNSAGCEDRQHSGRGNADRGKARRHVRTRLFLKHDGRMARPNVAGRACRLARTRLWPQRQARQAIRETETSSEGGKTRSGSANVDKSNQVREKQSENQRAWMRMDEETLQCRELQGHDENETVIKK